MHRMRALLAALVLLGASDGSVGSGGDGQDRLVQDPASGSGTRFTMAYRYFLPLAAEVILALAALSLLVDSLLGLYALPVFLTLMLIVGTQDAVDLVSGTTVAGRPGDGLFPHRPQHPRASSTP